MPTTVSQGLQKNEELFGLWIVTDVRLADHWYEDAEELEDRADVEAARAALAEMEETGAEPVPLSKLKRDLGL
jgi:hypothetical protein